MKQPLISIVTVAFNASRYVESTACSIASQTYPFIECILIDGGSTDDTVERYRSVLRERATVYSEKDDGIYDAMNKGAQKAQGDYILYLHADDAFVNEDSLARLVAALPDDRAGWVCAFCILRNAGDEVIRKESPVEFTFGDMLRANQVRHPTALVPLDYVRQFPFRKEFKYAMDYDHFLRIWKRYGPPVILKEYITYFRLDGSNMSSQLENSLKDELAARLAFRKDHGESFAALLDRVVFMLRWFKIKLYYRPLLGRSIKKS